MLPEKICRALATAVSANGRPIALHEPIFAGNEWAYVKDCLDSGWVSSAGAYVDRFEKQLAEFTGVRRAVAVVNGTAALHIALKLVGVEAGDEVLVPSLTFVATANAVAYCGAVPHFVDSEERTLGLDPFKLKEYLDDHARVTGGVCYNRYTGRPIRAVVPMHTFGHPVDLDPLIDVSSEFCLAVVEDAAEALGSFYRGRHTGNWGRAAILSFNGNKTITTGGGGAILTNDETLADRARHITTTAKLPHKWDYFHDEIGYNYRMPNLNAALGCAQMEELPGILERKRVLADRYVSVFGPLEGVTFFQEPPFARSNYWLNALLLDDELSDQKERILQASNDAHLMTRPAWTLLHKLPAFQQAPRMGLEVAESLERRIINIPSSAFLAPAPSRPEEFAGSIEGR